MFLAAGLYASGFVVTEGLGVLGALLAAFALLDVLALYRLRTIETRPAKTFAELQATREQIDRLARFLLFGGIAFGAVFVVAVAILWLA